jgi:hypothetical protein
MALTLYIDSVDRTPQWFLPGLQGGQMRFSRVSGGRGPATFRLFDPDGETGYRPSIGELVELYDDATLVMAGEILDVDEGPLSDELDTGVVTTITVADQQRIPEQALYSVTYEANTVTLAQVLTDLVDDCLADHGVTLDAGQATGPTIPFRIEYVNAYAVQLLNDLQTALGWIWRLPPTLALVMVEAATASSGITLDEDADIEAPVRYAQRRSTEYATRVILDFGEGNRDVEDVLEGDGVTTVFDLHYRSATTSGYGHVYLDDVLELMGVYGVDDSNPSVPWLLDQANGQVRRNTGQGYTAPADEAEIRVPLPAVFPAQVQWEDAAAIAANGGVAIEKRISRTDVFDWELAQALVDGIGPSYSATPKTVTVRHREGLAWPGQTVVLDIPWRALSGTFMILSVEAEDDVDGELVYVFECLEGDALQRVWLDYFRGVSGASSGSGALTGGVSIVEVDGVQGSGTVGNVAVWVASGQLGAGPLASTVVLTSGSYADPSWLTSLSASKLTTGTIPAAAIAGRSLGDLGTRSAGDLSSGNLAHARMPTGAGTWSVTPTISGAVTIAPATDVSALLVTPTAAAYTGNAIYVNTTRAASSAFSLLTLLADGVPQFTVDGAGITTIAGQVNIATHLRPTVNWTSDVGSQTLKLRKLYAAELEVDTLVAQDVIATIGGEVLTIPTSTLSAAIDASTTAITVEHNDFAVDDQLWLEARGQFEMLLITAGPTGTGPYGYTVTRNRDGSGGNSWIAGDAVVSTGTTGDGYIHQYARSGRFAGTGPTIVGQVRTGTAYNDIAARWAIGNLNGVGYDGIVTNVYGAAFGVPTGTHTIVTDAGGFQILHNTTVKFQADPDGDLFLAGSLTAQGSGSFLAGDLTIDEDGIRLPSASSATFNAVRTYGFTTSSGSDTGLRCYESGSDEVVMVCSLESGTTADLRRAGIEAFQVNSVGVTVTAFGSGQSHQTAVVASAIQGTVTLTSSQGLGTEVSSLLIDGDEIVLQLDASSGLFTVEGDTDIEGDADIEGLLSVTGLGAHTFSASGAGENSLVVRNTNTADASGVVVGADADSATGYAELQSIAGTTVAQLIAYGQSHATVAGVSRLQAGGAGGLQIRAYHASGPIKLYANGTTEVARLTSTGLYIGGAANAAYQIELQADSAGKPSTSTWTITSDARTKKNIRDYDHGLDLLRQIRLKEYEHNGLGGTVDGARGVGVLAQDVEAILPTSVGRRQDDDDTMTFNAHELFMLTVNAAKELDARVTTLEGR